MVLSLYELAYNSIGQMLLDNPKLYSPTQNYIEPRDMYDKNYSVKIKDKKFLYGNLDDIRNGKCSQILNLPRSLGINLVIEIFQAMDILFALDIPHFVEEEKYNRIMTYSESQAMKNREETNLVNNITIFFINHICPYVEKINYDEKTELINIKLIHKDSIVNFNYFTVRDVVRSLYEL